jgi:hypothetical protein
MLITAATHCHSQAIFPISTLTLILQTVYDSRALHATEVDVLITVLSGKHSTALYTVQVLTWYLCMNFTRSHHGSQRKIQTDCVARAEKPALMPEIEKGGVSERVALSPDQCRGGLDDQIAKRDKGILQ